MGRRFGERRVEGRGGIDCNFLSMPLLIFPHVHLKPAHCGDVLRKGGEKVDQSVCTNRKLRHITCPTYPTESEHLLSVVSNNFNGISIDVQLASQLRAAVTTLIFQPFISYHLVSRQAEI